MVFWIIVGLSSLIAATWIVLPFLRAHTVELGAADGTISIYRDQLDEIGRDLGAGLIGSDEHDAARAEIERRALKAARTIDQGLSVSNRSLRVAVIVILATTAMSIGFYASVGEPGAEDRPLALRNEERLIRMAESGDAASRIQLLIQAVGEDPESFEDWWMLARSYSAFGDHASAVDAYQKAVVLSNERPGVLSAYSEALTLANGNKVPNAARLIFEQLVRDTADPRARYYVALAKAQAQDFESAVTEWAALAQDSSPNAPWMPLVRRDITNMARFLKRDITEFLPDATPDEIVAAGGGLLPAERDQVASAENAKDYKGWIELANSHAAAGDTDGAIAALENAREQYSGAPFVLQKIADAERELGLNFIPAASRGPSDQDIAAAAEMTEQERSEMIEGMVAGLAARLEVHPDDPAGWVMLIRSYSTLGRTEAAMLAYTTARSHFEKDPAALNLIVGQVGELVR